MIIEFWNKHAKGYKDLIRNALVGNEVEKWQDFIFNEIDRDSKLNILDIGTGPGFFPIILTSENISVTGIDISPVMISHAEENLQNHGIKAKILNMDCQKTNFEDGEFDVIICRNLVWTLPEPQKAYVEWKRILKPGGKIMVFDGSWYIHHYDDEAKAEFQRRSKELFDRKGVYGYNYGDIDTDKDDYEMRINLYLSDKKRPEWDCEFLESIGMKIEKVERNYLDKMMSKEELENRTDIAPTFYIRASK